MGISAIIFGELNQIAGYLLQIQSCSDEIWLDLAGLSTILVSLLEIDAV